MRPRYLEAMEESTVDTALLLASSVRYNQKTDRLDIFPLAQAIERAKQSPLSATIFTTVKTELGVRVLVFDRHKRVIYDSQDGEALGRDYSKWNDVIRAFRGEYGARSTHDDPVVPGSSVKYVTLPIRAAGQIVGALTVGKPSRSVVPLLESARKRALLFGIALGVVALVVGLLLSLWLTNPIDKLTMYAAAIRDGRKAKLPPLGPVELKIMGATLEQMKTALEGKKYVEEYTHTLTHELKSPLSAIQGAAEILAENPPEEKRKQFIENIRTETARITDLVNRMLLIASIDSKGNKSEFAPVNLKSLVEEVVKSFAPILTQKMITLEIRDEVDVVVRGDAFLIRHAISNLVQNAVEFSPEKGKLEVSLSTANGFAVFQVKDEGPGFPVYAKDKIFDRFYSLPRPDTQKRSSGLGLSLVKEVAILHAGDVLVENIPSRGTQATLRFPV